MTKAFIVAAARTPIGAFLGGLSSISAPKLGATAIRAALERTPIAPEDVDEVIMGNVLSAGLGQAPARQAALGAGLPSTVPALTINKVCGSGLKAVMLGAQAIRAGDVNCVAAGGMENMSAAPHLMRGLRQGQKLGDLNLEDSMILDGLTCAFESCHMGLHAEYTARFHSITREDQDAFAAESQRRANAAYADQIFQDEIVPVVIRGRKGDVSVNDDECLRPNTSHEGLANLRPVFEDEGTVTAGNASTLGDGAAAVVVVSEELARSRATDWRARVTGYHTSGVEPRDLFYAPVAAIEGAVAKAGWSLDDVDLFEINEAFASQMIACTRGLNLPTEKVNVYGGGISLGHPIGASGARTLVTLLYALRRNQLQRGVVSLCLGGGNAVSMAVELESD